MRNKVVLSLFMFFTFEKTKCFNAFFSTGDNALFDMGSGDQQSSEDFSPDNSENEVRLTEPLITDVSGSDFRFPFWFPQPDVCKPAPKGRVPWILHMRDSDYEWKDHTHLAVIALAVNDHRGDVNDMKKMELQLEARLTRELLKNKTHPINDIDLALYIHALMATQKNPRNFHGTDFVADLLHRVESATRQGKLNPFLVLALCNAHAVTYSHLYEISKFANITHDVGISDVNAHPDVDSRIGQRKALVYKALACGAKHDPRTAKFTDEMQTIENGFHRKYNAETGSFGNVYTTSLAVQAFTAGNRVRTPPKWWDAIKTLEYLEDEAEIDVNLIKAYYIEMALNAEKYNFIRDLYSGSLAPASNKKAETYDIQYSIKKDLRPGIDLSLTMTVESGTNFYEVMNRASNTSAAFNFESHPDINGNPVVYSIAGVPNDVEENMFWRLCRRYDVYHERHVSEIVPHDDSPANLVTKHHEHYIYLYGNTDCSKL